MSKKPTPAPPAPPGPFGDAEAVAEVLGQLASAAAALPRDDNGEPSSTRLARLVKDAAKRIDAIQYREWLVATEQGQLLADLDDPEVGASTVGRLAPRPVPGDGVVPELVPPATVPIPEGA